MKIVISTLLITIMLLTLIGGCQNSGKAPDSSKDTRGVRSVDDFVSK